MHLAPRSQKYRDGFPVAYDPNFLKKTHGNVREIKALSEAHIYNLLPQPDEIPDVQDMAYGDLREKFSAAFIEGKIDQCDPVKMREFFKSCQTALQQGRLCASWLYDAPEDSFIAARSLRYEKRLKEECPHFEV